MTESQDALADLRVIATCLVILTVIGVGAALVPLRPVLVPLLVALLFTYCLRPVIDLQTQQLRMPRGLAVGCTVLLGLALLGLFGFLAARFAADLAHNLPAYKARFAELVRQATQAVPFDRLGLRAPQGQLVVFSEENVRRMVSWAIGPATDVLSGGGLVTLFVLFMLLGGGPAVRRPGSLLAEIEVRAQRYILQMVGFSVATGLLVGLCLTLVGVDYAFAFGFIAFLLNFIPTVGPLVATLLPLPVVLLDEEMSVAAKVLAVALPAAVQGAFAVIQPRVQGEAQDLHPVTTMAALVFFGSIWGIPGAALAVPVTGVIKIILERIPTTRPAAAWLAGRIDLPRPAEPPADEILPNRAPGEAE